MLSSIVMAQPADISHLLKQADTLREEGQTFPAIALYDQGIDLAQKQKDYNSIVSALNGRLIAWKHRYYDTEEQLYALFVKQHAEAMKFLAEKHGLTNRMPVVHFQLATAHTQLQEYSQAEIELAEAIRLYPQDNAEKGDWIAHLGYLMYRNGKKIEGKAKALEGIDRILNHPVEPFKRNVWLSGAYLRLAELLEKDDPAESKKYFEQADAIIKANPDLVIRSKQLAKWHAKLSKNH